MTYAGGQGRKSGCPGPEVQGAISHDLSVHPLGRLEGKGSSMGRTDGT